MITLGALGFTELFLILAILLLPLFALIDILKNDFEGNDKLIWVIVVVFLFVVGSILYFTIGQKQKITKTNREG